MFFLQFLGLCWDHNMRSKLLVCLFFLTWESLGMGSHSTTIRSHRFVRNTRHHRSVSIVRYPESPIFYGVSKAISKLANNEDFQGLITLLTVWVQASSCTHPVRLSVNQHGDGSRIPPTADLRHTYCAWALYLQ